MENIFSSITEDGLTPAAMLILLGCSLALGFAISIVYILTHRKTGFAPSFAITLVMLPVIIAVIILLIGDNVARAFSLAGAFTIIRFRSAPADPKDITYIFFTLAAGLALGLGYIAYAALFTAVLALVTVFMEVFRYAVPRNDHMILKVTVPENLDYQNLLTDILDEYALSYKLKKVRTVDFGALFETVYYIELKKDCNQKEMIDKIRARNGNLNVQLLFREYEDKLYQTQ